jgi:tRNA1(Val) A37 N6-methylase TrmN6
MCSDPLRAAAQWELRGGIEDYCHAASKVLSTSGRFVTCAAALPEGRTDEAFASAGLAIVSRREVLPRPDKPPFLTLVAGSLLPQEVVSDEPPLLLRNADGTRTEEHIEIREWFGVPASLR